VEAVEVVAEDEVDVEEAEAVAREVVVVGVEGTRRKSGCR